MMTEPLLGIVRKSGTACSAPLVVHMFETHLVCDLKILSDPSFVDKWEDIVGLHLLLLEYVLGGL